MEMPETHIRKPVAKRAKAFASFCYVLRHIGRLVDYTSLRALRRVSSEIVIPSSLLISATRLSRLFPRSPLDRPRKYLTTASRLSRERCGRCITNSLSRLKVDASLAVFTELSCFAIACCDGSS